MRGRTSVAIALLAAALWAMVGTASGASVTTVPDAPSYGGLVPGPDGLLWHAEPGSDERDQPVTRVMRVGAGGTSVTTVPGVAPYWGAEPRPLPDGSMGLVVQRLDERTDAWVYDGLALVRLLPGSGAVASVERLPHAADKAVSVAIAPDGAVWFARCNRGLARRAPDGRLTSVPLSSLRCNPDSTYARQGLAFVFDPTGAVWFANVCMGRIARVSLAGGVREWPVARAGCGLYSANLTVVADPSGGVFYAADGSEGSGSGRIHRGRHQQFGWHQAGAFAADGALWRIVQHGIERRGTDGSRRFFARAGLPSLSGLAPVGTDGMAVVRAAFWRSDPDYDPHNTPVYAYLDGRVTTMRPDGTETSSPLPDGRPDSPSQLSGAYLALGPDGAFYVREARIAIPRFFGPSRLLHVVPGELAPPQPSTVRVSAVLGRVGRTTWLQLSCGAELARFCLGTVRLTGGGSSPAPTGYALAGRARSAVPVALDAAALRQLRSGRTLRMTAIVRTDDGTVTRSPVAIGSTAPR